MCVYLLSDNAWKSYSGCCKFSGTNESSELREVRLEPCSRAEKSCRTISKLNVEADCDQGSRKSEGLVWSVPDWGIAHCFLLVLHSHLLRCLI